MVRTKSPFPDFETSLAELERIASSMESGEMPLEQALATYRRGVELLRHCQGTLSSAEQELQGLEQEPAAIAATSPQDPV